MAKIGWNALLFFMLFQGIIEYHFPEIPLYSYWDEFLFLFCFALWPFCSSIKGKGRLSIRKESVELALPWLCVVAIGCLGNLAFHYAMSSQAIIRDVVGFLKFPLTFLIFREAGWDAQIARAFRGYGAQFLKLAVSLMFFSAILSLFVDIGMSQDSIRHGVHSFQFLFNHPTMAVYASATLLCLLFVDEPRKKNFAFQAMSIIIIVLTMRTKGFAFIGVYFMIRYSDRFPKNLRFLYVPCVGLLGLAILYPKLSLYMSWSHGRLGAGSGRETLWLGSVKLLKDCFPLGSGFATFASHLSGKYRSRVYDFINIWEFWGRDGSPTPVLGDTGYPYYIGQFGLLGLICSAYGIWRILKLWKTNARFPLRGMGKAESLFMFYVAISLTSEALLITHGFELGVILAVILQCDERNAKQRKNEWLAPRFLPPVFEKA